MAADLKETNMFRTLVVLTLCGCGILLVALGGQIGPIDLTEVPLPLFAFAGTTALVLLALKAI
jgi:hypothetical protein